MHQKFKRIVGRSRNVVQLMRKNQAAGRRLFHGFEHIVFYADLVLQSPGGIDEGFKDFRHILADYPDTILLLNHRDREAWIRSRERHGHGAFLQNTMQVHGFADPEACKAFWREDWDRHLADVRLFMRDRPAQLVEFDVERDGIEELVERLPAYELRPEAWRRIGGRRREFGRMESAFRRWNARRRMSSSDHP